ncbi:MAG: transketolase family protein [Candidatus Omnitrophica bacterium]|nr:transketolase family protein [Candidatus Omnitrophota bacterium]
MEKRLGKATRDAYGKTLIELGKENPNIVVLDADLSKSTKTCLFQEVFPDRFFNVGIQEANLVGVASGLAASGKIPFVSSFASFLVLKSYDQLRMGAAFPELNVKVVASHGGISVGEDGASQMAIEDIALMTSLPGCVVTIPCDEFSAAQMTRKFAEYKGLAYMRTCRPKAPIIYDEKVKIQIGKGIKLRDGKDITLVANGLLVFEALQAAEDLAKEKIEASVIDMHTVKPLDRDLLISEARKTGHVVVAEEHQIWGGLGSAVATLLAQECPARMAFVAIQDTYAESGPPDELLDKYGLRAVDIVKAAKKIL